MKKIIIPICAAILLIILGISIYFIVKDKSAEQVNNPDLTISPTVAPASTSAPSTAPTPLPVEAQSVYPAYQVIDGIKRYGYIDLSGTFVIDPVYDYADDFRDGVAVVRQGEDNLVINQAGAEIYKSKNNIGNFHNGAASILTTEEAWLFGFIDPTGKVIVEPKYSIVSDFDKNGHAYAYLPETDTYDLIDIAGNVVESYTPNIDSDYVLSFEDGYAVYAKSSKFGVASIATGKTILEPIYSSIEYLGNDLFAVKDPGIEIYEAEIKPAAIFDPQGKQLTDYVYYDISNFNGEYASACDDTSIFFIGTDGKPVDSLPSFDGSGTLTLQGNIIKADVDGVLTYYRTDNTILWKADTTINLGSGITVKDMIFKPLRTVLVHYPQLDGLQDANVQNQINEQLETVFIESRANITKEETLTVSDSFSASLKNNLLIISMSGYDYYAGAAHGMPLQNYYFADITTGKFYELEDLFKKGSDYKTPINEIISEKIKEDIASGESMFFEEMFTGISDAQYFYLTEDGITIYFYPYDIAAYAAGFPEFTVTFDQLEEVLDKDGDFWKAFMGADAR
jgi:hypothetical protein